MATGLLAREEGLGTKPGKKPGAAVAWTRPPGAKRHRSRGRTTSVGRHGETAIRKSHQHRAQARPVISALSHGTAAAISPATEGDQ